MCYRRMDQLTHGAGGWNFLPSEGSYDVRNERTIKMLLKQADVVFPIFFDGKIGAGGDGQSIKSRDQKEGPPSGIFLV